MHEFVVKNGLIVSGSVNVSGSVTAQSFTGSFSGSISNAVSASYALTASFAQNFNPLATASYALQALTASYALNAGDSVWTGSGGNIYYLGGNVGIGDNNPSSKLSVTGNITSTQDSTFNSVSVGKGGGSIVTNTRVGDGSLTYNTTGVNNTAVGSVALRFNK